MAPRRTTVSRHGHSLSVSMADENAPTSLVGPQRNKVAAATIGLAAGAHKPRAAVRSSVPAAAVASTRRVLGDVSNAVAAPTHNKVRLLSVSSSYPPPLAHVSERLPFGLCV